MIKVHTAIIFKNFDEEQKLINSLKKDNKEFSFQWLIPADDDYNKLSLWGVKEDASNVNVGIQTLEFDTPWNEPGIELFEKIIEKCPDIYFTAKYAYEDFSRCGYYNYNKEGLKEHIIEPFTDEADKFIIETFGYDPMEEKDAKLGK